MIGVNHVIQYNCKTLSFTEHFVPWQTVRIIYSDRYSSTLFKTIMRLQVRIPYFSNKAVTKADVQVIHFITLSVLDKFWRDKINEIHILTYYFSYFCSMFSHDTSGTKIPPCHRYLFQMCNGWWKTYQNIQFDYFPLCYKNRPKVNYLVE